MQTSLFKKGLPDLRDVPLSRPDNPESSKAAAAKYQKKSQRGKCWIMYRLVVQFPGLTFMEYWNKCGGFLQERKFINSVDVSRQLHVLKKKRLIYSECTRECKITGNLSSVFYPQVEIGVKNGL